MQYNFTNISIADDVNGGKYVKTTACKAGDPGDRGFSLPFFNPEIIAAVQASLARGEQASFTLPAEIDEETVTLKAVYCRRATDANGKLTNEPVIDRETNKPALYKKLRVHTIFQYSMHDAFYVSGERKGMRIMEEVWENGNKVSRPAKAFDLDDLGRPIRNYMRGWSPEERKDQILKTFFMVAPQEYQQQTIVAPEAPQQPAAQPSLEQAAQNLFQPAAPQAGAAPQQQLNPLA